MADPNRIKQGKEEEGALVASPSPKEDRPKGAPGKAGKAAAALWGEEEAPPEGTELLAPPSEKAGKTAAAAGGSGKQAAKHPKGSRVPPAGKGGATAKSAKGASPSPTPNRAVDPEEEDKSASAGPVLAPELERKGAGGGGNNHTLAKTFVSLLAAIAATALLVLLAHAGPRMLGEWQRDRQLRWQKLKRMEMGGGGPMAAREAMAGLGSPFASDCGTAGSGRSALDLFALDGLKSVRPWALWPSPPSGDEGDEEDPRGPEGGGLLFFASSGAIKKLENPELYC